MPAVTAPAFGIILVRITVTFTVKIVKIMAIVLVAFTLNCIYRCA